MIDSKMFKKAILAGIMIGLGVAIKTLVENPYLGAFLFSLGLLSVFELQLNLFTGKVGFSTFTIKQLALIFTGKVDFSTFTTKQLALIFICNAIGILITILLFNFNPNYVSTLQQASITKFAKPWYLMLAMGTVCGMLIHTATRAKTNKIITILCIMVFILAGAEHCIADMANLFYAPGLLQLGNFCLVVIGNIIGAKAVEFLLN